MMTEISIYRFALSIILALLVTGPLSPAHAQDPNAGKPPPPAPPYVGRLSGDYIFTKKFTYKTQPENPNPTQEQKDLQLFFSHDPILAEVDSKETGNLRWDKENFTNGNTVEVWRVGPYRLRTFSSNPNAVSVLAATQEGYEDMPDFQELSWINGTHYQGEQTLQGKTCYVYKQDDQTAWIEKSTRLPLAFESKSMQVTYTYQASEGPLQLPEKFAKRLQEVTRG